MLRVVEIVCTIALVTGVKAELRTAVTSTMARRYERSTVGEIVRGYIDKGEKVTVDTFFTDTAGQVWFHCTGFGNAGYLKGAKTLRFIDTGTADSLSFADALNAQDTDDRKRRYRILRTHTAWPRRRCWRRDGRRSRRDG